MVLAGPDIIPATVFELKLPQTSPDTREKKKTRATVPGKGQVDSVGAGGQGWNFGGQRTPLYPVSGWK